MEPIRVVINGAFGRMGQEITKAVVCEPGLRVVGAVEKEVTQQYLPLTEAPELIVLSSDLDSLLKSCDADVVVDFTDADVSMAAARVAIKQKVIIVKNVNSSHLLPGYLQFSLHRTLQIQDISAVRQERLHQRGSR